jgi:hypothetical protein
VPYPPVAFMHSQQRWGEPAGLVPRPSVFSRLNNGQSSSSGASQDHVITSRTLTPQESEKVPMEAPITNHDGLIVIKEIPALK